MTDSPAPRRREARELDPDALDGGLIRALQEDGRASIHDLAARLGVSRDFVSQRLRLLTEQEGLRVVAALDPGFAGHHVLVHATLDVDGPAGPVAALLSRLPDTVLVSLVSGSSPLVFESRHGDVSELHEMLDQVRAIPAVRQIHVTTYVEVLKGFFVAHSRDDMALDRMDYELISILQGNGRTSYRELSDAVHLSPSSVRARVHKLIEGGVIRISAIKAGGLSRNRLAIGVGISARDDVSTIRDYITASPAIDFAARTHGNHDFIATIVGTSSTAVLRVIEELRALPEVGSLESWAHLDIVKEDYTRTLGRIVGE